MADKRVSVTIDGTEHVSDAAASAEAGLTAFGRRIPFVIDAAKLLELGIEALSRAIGAAKQFVSDSIQAYDNYAASNVRLAAQSKITGVSVDSLKTMAERARKEFSLGVADANDLSIAVAKYGARSGDASRNGELMAAVLNLGAANGETAKESLERLNQALAGSDEGFNKLGLANPSQLWKDYADKIGVSVGKLTEQQQRQAEVNAIIEAGNKVTGTYAERMSSAAGQQEIVNNKLENAKIAFGSAIQPVRLFVIQGLAFLIDICTPLVVRLGQVASFLSEVFVGSFRLVQSAVGSVVEVVGKLTGSKSLEEWGRNQSQAMSRFIDSLNQMDGSAKKATTAVETHGQAHMLAAVKIEATGDKALTASEKAKRAADEYYDKASKKLGKPLADVIDITTTAIGNLADAGREQLEPKKAEEFAGWMAHLRAEADKGNAAVMSLGQNAGNAKGQTKQLALDVAGIARAAIDAADAFGVVDAKTASALNSAVNLASSIARLASGDMSSIPGIIASAVNLISSMIGGDSARKRLITENTQEMARLRKEVGNLSLNVTGETFAKVQDALGSVMGQIRGGRGARNESDVLNALLARGLTMNDLNKVAEGLGIRIRSDSGALSVDGLRQLFESMGLVELGQFGQDFASQMESVTRGFDVNKTGDVGQIAALGRLGGQFSSALAGVVDTNDLSGTRARLAALFARMQSGGLSAQELGGLTGSEFLDLVTNIIGRIDSLGPATASTADIVTAGGVSMPSGTVTSTASAAASSVGEILTSHSDFHRRTADAVEGSYEELKRVNVNLATLIDVTARVGSVDAMIGSRLTLERQLAGDASL